MIITCEACNTSFNLDGKMLKATGSKVRCSVCSKVFTAFPQQAQTPEPPAESVYPDAAPKIQAGPEPGLVAASRIASDEPDVPAAADTVDAHTPETDVLEEDAGALFAEGSDLDFALDDETEDGVSATEIEDAVSGVLDDVQADISFESDFEQDLAHESDIADESGATVIASLDDDDLDLDLLPETGGDSEGTTTVMANLDDDSLDLDSDFSLEFEGASASAVSAEEVMPETLDDLDDLNLTLDMEPDGQAPQLDAVAPESGEPSLDDLSMDFDLETDADMAGASSAAQTDIAAFEDDLDLTLDLDDVGTGEMEPAEESAGFEDDLDLSSLDGLLKDDEESKDDSVTVVVDEGDEPELALDMDDETSMSVAGATDAPGAETLEDLEFDLDGDGKVETLDIDDVDDGDQEIDLSEIEKMLEEPETDSAKFSSVPEQDLDLDIEASLETEKWMSDSRDDNQLVTDEELDLSELEQVLEDVDTEATDDELEDPDLELDLGDGEALGTSTETVAVDNRLDFDLSDFEDAPIDKTGADASAHESVDMKLEFEMEEGGHSEKTLEDEGLETTVVVPEPKAEKGKRARSESATHPKSSPKPKPVKKGISKSLVFLLIIAILGVGAYGSYFLLKQKGIEIPFLSEYLQPPVQDAGNLKLTTFDINSKFVDNSSVGKLFVISGNVKNGYTESRGMITMTGQIFSTGKVPVHQQTVYCGNVMSDLELANLEWEKIEARLSNRLGDNRSNVKVEPGTSIPFMVVFSGLPDDLEEFTIEVTSSTPLK